MPVRLKIGVVGCGGYGQVHVKSASMMPDIEVVGYYDVLRSKADDYAAHFGGTVFGTAADLVGAVDVVVLATPPMARLETIRMAAAAGKHVLCQKPLALYPAETSEICRIVTDSGIRFGVGFNGRFTPQLMRVHDMLVSGELGELVYCWRTLHTDLPLAHWQSYMAEGHWRTKQETSGGRVFEMGSHDIDFLLKLGGPPTSAFAVCAVSHPSLSTDDTDLAIIEFEKGYAKWELSKTPQSVTLDNAGVMGTEAMVVTAPGGGLRLRRRGASETTTIPVEPHVELPGVEGPAGICEIRDRRFYDAILNGREYESDCWAGKRAADTCRAIVESAASGTKMLADDGVLAPA